MDSPMNIKKAIESLNSQRNEFLDKRNDSYDEETMKYQYDPEEIDSLGDNIIELILAGKENLPFEFIMEQLTMLGQAPSLLYDDNGNFAISGDGMQEISTEPSDIWLSHFIKKDDWKPTIREALYHYLSDFS